MSQERLAHDAEISTRHLSCLETGRAKPSRQMVLVLGSALELGLRERNALLEAAGFVAAYRDEPLDGPEATTPIAGKLADALEASDIQPAGPAGPTAALVGAREWSPTTIASLLRAEKARGKPRHRVLDVLDDHPFATRGGAHDPAAVLLLTSSSLTLEQLVGAVEATVDIEVVREMLIREQKRTGTTKPREAVLLACEAALERLLEVSP